MSTSKHDKQPGEGPFTSDLESDPRIGQSAGLWATGEDADLLEADNTQEGDTDNGAAGDGSVGSKLGRTNK